MQVKPMNIRNIKAGLKAATQYVQDQKIGISKGTIRGLQNVDRWSEEYLSYVTSERKNNQYKDPDKFFRVMHSKPDLYARKFIFRPLLDSAGVLKEATLYALQIAQQQSKMYGYRSGFYGSSFEVLLNRSLLTNAAQLDDLTNDSTTTILNTAPYASTVDARALYVTKIGGVLFYAAQQVKKKYPQLAVRFVYSQSQYIDRANHIYQVPTLTLGNRGVIVDKITRPGKNIRKRARAEKKRRSV